MIRLSDEQWERIRSHFPEEHIPDGRPGRKPISTRRVLEAALWILNTGAQRHMLPQSYPNFLTEFYQQTALADQLMTAGQGSQSQTVTQNAIAGPLAKANAAAD